MPIDTKNLKPGDVLYDARLSGRNAYIDTYNIVSIDRETAWALVRLESVGGTVERKVSFYKLRNLRREKPEIDRDSHGFPKIKAKSQKKQEATQ